MTNEETIKEASRIIKALLEALDYADDYANNRDGFTIFNNESVDAYENGRQFLKRFLKN